MLARGFVADAAVLWLPAIRLLPATGNHVAFSVSARMSRALNNFFPMLEQQTFALVQCLSSLANLLTTVREPLSSQFPFLKRGRSMKSVSLQC